MTSLLAADEAGRLLAEELAGRLPDARGRFGPFGGRYVPETLVPALDRLQEGVERWLHAEDFQRDYARELAGWRGGRRRSRARMACRGSGAPRSG